MSEKLQILNMVKDSTITPEEAVELLNALGDSEDTNSINKKASFIKINILDPEDNTNVNVKLPVGLVNIGLKIADKFSPDLKKAGLSSEDIDGIMEAIREQEMGKIVDINSDDGSKVEISIE